MDSNRWLGEGFEREATRFEGGMGTAAAGLDSVDHLGQSRWWLEWRRIRLFEKKVRNIKNVYGMGYVQISR